MASGDIRNWQSFLQDEEIRFKEKYESVGRSADVKISDFSILKTIGVGTYGSVTLAKKKNGRDVYAIKIMDKETIIKLSQIRHSFEEKRILQSINFPFIINSVCSFKDNCYLYIVMPYIPGGELFAVLRRFVRFPEGLARFYATQVLLALEYLHFLDVVYRDLKPENLLLGRDGYLTLVDLGFCKIVKTRTYTMCGTAEYMAPEIILSKGCGKAADWWSFGVLVYEMCVGISPFFSQNVNTIFVSITEGNYDPTPLPSDDVRDLVNRLLQREPPNRLGNVRKGLSDVRSQKWFSNTNWMDILNKKEVPPFQPRQSGEKPFDYTLENVSLRDCPKVIYEQEFMEF